MPTLTSLEHLNGQGRIVAEVRNGTRAPAWGSQRQWEGLSGVSVVDPLMGGGGVVLCMMSLSRPDSFAFSLPPFRHRRGFLSPLHPGVVLEAEA